MKKDKINIFERHPLWTLFFIFSISTIMLDFFTANVYKLINGYPWSAREQVRYQAKYREALKIEKLYRVESTVYSHGLAKNKSVNNAHWGDLAYNVRTNSLGFKDRVVRNIPLCSDKYRILFMGDSFTEGLGFDYDDTFVGLIDKELSKKGEEVFNAGVLGYSPTIYWKKIEYLIKKVGFKFNEVVVFIDISDIEDEAIYHSLDEHGNVVRRDARNGQADNIKKGNINFAKKMTSNITLFIKNNSILMHYVLDKWLLLSSMDVDDKMHDAYKKRSRWTIDKNIYDEYGKEGVEKCALYMDKLHILLQSNGISLTVAVYPWPDQILSDSLDSIQVLYWRKWCAEHDAHFINYFPHFLTGRTKKEKEKVIDKYYIRNDIHFNKDGHKLIANVFLDNYKTRENSN
ncbi:MAG: hypothetical protein NTW65_03320 [Deltaproteobacteria bacterium]|nr:hypothetical protein [Deltaproteobacteria bacterium]